MIGMTYTEKTMCSIKSIYEDGYWWVEIPDELWEKRQYATYYAGMDVT